MEFSKAHVKQARVLFEIASEAFQVEPWLRLRSCHVFRVTFEGMHYYVQVFGGAGSCGPSFGMTTDVRNVSLGNQSPDKLANNSLHYQLFFSTTECVNPDTYVWALRNNFPFDRDFRVPIDNKIGGYPDFSIHRYNVGGPRLIERVAPFTLDQIRLFEVMMHSVIYATKFLKWAHGVGDIATFWPLDSTLERFLRVDTVAKKPEKMSKFRIQYPPPELEGIYKLPLWPSGYYPVATRESEIKIGIYTEPSMNDLRVSIVVLRPMTHLAGWRKHSKTTPTSITSSVPLTVHPSDLAVI